MDKIKRFFLCFFVTLACGWEIGAAVALAMELRQTEHGDAGLKAMWQRMASRDTILDLAADAGGIVFAIMVIGVAG